MNSLSTENGNAVFVAEFAQNSGGAQAPPLHSAHLLSPGILHRMATNIFVYGTLMRGDTRHRALAGQKFLGDATTSPRYRMYNVGTYPALVESPEGLAIEGELWNVDEACLARLDDIEGVSEGLYARRAIKLQPPFEASPAEAYFYLESIVGMADCGARWSRDARKPESRKKTAAADGASRSS